MAGELGPPLLNFILKHTYFWLVAGACMILIVCFTDWTGVGG